jgi:hypothetical protein
MLAIFVSIFLLTVGDAIFSAWEVKMGWMTEGNVLIQNAVMSYPVLTCTLAALAVGAVLFGIWKVRHRIKWLPSAMIGLLVIKSGVMLYHFVGVSQAIYLW